MSMETWCRKLWGLRVGTKKRSLTIRPDGEDPDGIEAKLKEENQHVYGYRASDSGSDGASAYRGRGGYRGGYRGRGRGGSSFWDSPYQHEVKLQIQQESIRQRNSDIYGPPDAPFRVHPLIPSVKIPVPVSSATTSTKTEDSDYEPPSKRMFKPNCAETGAEGSGDKRTYQPHGVKEEPPDPDEDEDDEEEAAVFKKAKSLKTTETKKKKGYLSWFPQAKGLGSIKKEK